MVQYLDKYAEKLSSSGLDLKDGEKLKMKLYTAESARQTLALPQATAGIKIPYFEPDGKPSKFYRYRNLEDNRGQWDKISGAKQLRYIQPKGTGLSVYLPPIGAGERWVEALADPEEPLVITEGEFKAAAACKAGLLTVGLGGVWAWKSDGEPIPFFTERGVVWKERKVWICYDSDAVQNPKVRQAEAALAGVLGGLGAKPFIARLPSGAGGSKVGMDDYLLAHSKEQLIELMEQAEPYGPVAALHQLNLQVVYCQNPPSIINLADGKLMNQQIFENMEYATLKHQVEMETKDGLKRKWLPTAPEWRKWPNRAQTEKVTFAPGKEQLTAAFYNRWRGWAVQPNPAAGVAPWVELLDYVFQDYPEYREWFEQWCAYPLQHPGVKLNQACIFYGAQQGTGKTLMGVSLRYVYGKYGIQVQEAELYDKRKEWAIDKQFVLAEEGSGSDKLTAADSLKQLITQEEMVIDQKYVPKYTVPDCINYYLTSNRPNAFKLDITDRRYFVHEMNFTPLPDKFYAKYDEWLKRGGGTAALFDYLLKVDTSSFNPRAAAPRTAAKEDMIEFSQTDIERWVREVLRGEIKVMRDVVTAEELLMLYDPEGKYRCNVNTMAKTLKYLQVWQPNRGRGFPGLAKRVYAVRNAAKWQKAKLKDIADYYNGSVSSPSRKY